MRATVGTTVGAVMGDQSAMWTPISSAEAAISRWVGRMRRAESGGAVRDGHDRLRIVVDRGGLEN